MSPGTTPLRPLAAKRTALGLDHPAGCLPELVEEAMREKLAPVAFLDLVLTRQLERKDERRVATMLKLSGLPPGKTLEGFDWSFQPRVERRQIETLATCSYVRGKVNVLFLGPPGVGKSHLATALGVKAISAFDTIVLIVSIVSTNDGTTHRLVGSFLADHDTARGAAVAVLNATNRIMGNIFLRDIP